MTSITSSEAISPLRARMIEDMTVRSFGAATQRDYIRSVKKLAAFLGRSPDTSISSTPSPSNSSLASFRVLITRLPPLENPLFLHTLSI